MSVADYCELLPFFSSLIVVSLELLKALVGDLYFVFVTSIKLN